MTEQEFLGYIKHDDLEHALEQWDSMREDVKFLDALYRSGIESWEGFDTAVEDYSSYCVDD